MRDSQKQKYCDIDAENFYRLVLIVRGIAVSRPQNLVKFADMFTTEQDITLDDPLSKGNIIVILYSYCHKILYVYDQKLKCIFISADLKPEKDKVYQSNRHILYQLVEVMWLLRSLNPDKTALAPVIVPGLKHTEQLVHAIVDIIHAFNSCECTTTLAIYLQLLLSEDQLIAFNARQAICRVLKPRGKRRRVFIPSPPHCITPPEKTAGEAEEDKPTTTIRNAHETSRDESQRYDVDSVEAIAFLQQNDNAGLYLLIYLAVYSQ